MSQELIREVEELKARIDFLEKCTDQIYGRGFKEGVAYAALTLNVLDFGDAGDAITNLSSELDSEPNITPRSAGKRITDRLTELELSGRGEAGAPLVSAPL